jgi:hypothetical protein
MLQASVTTAAAKRAADEAVINNMEAKKCKGFL